MLTEKSLTEDQAIGIFRGEGFIGCDKAKPKLKRGIYLELKAVVHACDKNTVGIVAVAWKSLLQEIPSDRCRFGKVYRTEITGNRVEGSVRRWILNGRLTGEKAEQYFEAKARILRARRILFPLERRARVAKSIIEANNVFVISARRIVHKSHKTIYASQMQVQHQ